MRIKKIKSSSTFKSDSVKDTKVLAGIVAKNLKGGEIIFLRGPIGAGKTTLVKDIAKALKIKQSPASASFALVRTYASRKAKLAHIDLFRLTRCEVDNLGLDEILTDDKYIIAAEWPDALKNYFPQEKLEVKITLLSNDTRKFTFKAKGEKYMKILEKVENEYEKK